jgi:rubrerythrin
MTPVEALKMALQKEEASIELYRELAAKHPAIKELLSSLLDEEFKHKKLIEDKIAQLTRY